MLYDFIEPYCLESTFKECLKFFVYGMMVRFGYDLREDIRRKNNYWSFFNRDVSLVGLQRIQDI